MREGIDNRHRIIRISLHNIEGNGQPVMGRQAKVAWEQQYNKTRTPCPLRE